MSILLAAFAALSGAGSLDAASLTGWSDISLVHPTTSGTNEDRTITWSVGGARNISLSGVTGGYALSYRINSGSYVTYSTAFSLSSGQTLGWRVQSATVDASDILTVNDDTRGSAIDSFNVTKTGSP